MLSFPFLCSIILFHLFCFFFFFFSSRRRHTRCALVTGVQTCALPISSDPTKSRGGLRPDAALRRIGRDARSHHRDPTPPLRHQIGRASCRERVCQYV